MSSAIEQSGATVPWGPTIREDSSQVEVIEGTLYSVSELRRAVAAGAFTAGLLCALVGVSIGYFLGLRDGRSGR